MKKFQLHHRRSVRLKNYDYSGNGAYFVTICVQNRDYLFGRIYDGEMILNDAGKMIRRVWDEIPQYYKGIEIDTFQIMPNHIHGIIFIVGAGPRACPDHMMGKGQPQGVAPTGLSLSDVMGRLKTLTTKKYVDGVNQCNWPAFDRKLWQRNYYEHVIRNEDDLIRIRQYIQNNPINWERDELFHP